MSSKILSIISKSSNVTETFTNSFALKNMTLTELKNSVERRLTIENRSFHIQEDKSNNFFRLDLNTVHSKNIQQNWRPGTIRNACDEILARMNRTFYSI